MKRVVLSFVCFFAALGLMAQTYNLDIEAKIKGKYELWSDVKKTKITKLEHITSGSERKNNEEYYIYAGNKKIKVGSMEIYCNPKNIDELWAVNQINSTMPTLESKGMQMQLRQETHQDAVDFVSTMKSHGMEMTDAGLVNYIRGLMYKAAPKDMVDGRPGHPYLFVVDSPDENAFMFADGTLVLYTGLIANMHTEDELMAVICCEMAHYMLDHSIANINAAISRESRAAFWANVLTGVAAGADWALSDRYRWYMPGTLTLPVAQASVVIANKVTDYGGMKYGHKQDLEADAIAVKMLDLMGYDKNAVASVLARLQVSMNENRSTPSYVSTYTKPYLAERISKAGTLDRKCDVKFEKRVASAVSSVAGYKYGEGKYTEAVALVDRNIANNVAVADDYLIKANSMLVMNPSDKDRAEINSLIAKARQLNPADIRPLKTEILSAISAGDNKSASALLQQYIDNLETVLSSNSSRYSDITDYLNSEIDWARDTKVRIQ